jgi:indole-3-glycerol phosphate synthase
LETSLSLLPHFDQSIIKVSESGVQNKMQAKRMHQTGYDAVLVGEALVKAANPERFIQELCDVD